MLWTGCAHSPARCDQRPAALEQPPEDASAGELAWYRRRTTLLSEATRLYQAITRSVADKSGPYESDHFRSVTEMLGPNSHGDLLFEQLPDGYWAYRCDEVTRLYALAAYRYALAQAGRAPAGSEQAALAEMYFCRAVEARPDLVLPLAQREAMGLRARELFAATLRESSCYYQAGWRSDDRSAPGQGRPSMTRLLMPQ
jgi:hypothetical protein